MDLKINRLKKLPTSTGGELWINGMFFCYTLERPDSSIEGAVAPFCIPTGTYKVTPRWSNHNKMEVLGVNDVPGRTDIEFHSANWPSQLLGCIAVGDIQSQDYVGDSKVTFGKLMDITKNNDLTLEIV